VPLAGSGTALPLPDRRIAEGVTTGSGRSVASVVVRGEIDLLAWWEHARPSTERLEQLRLLAALAATASRRAGSTPLYAVARQLLAATDRDETLLGLATATADVLQAEIAAVFLATPDRTAVEAKAAVGHRTVGTARLRLAKGESLVGHVFETGEVYRTDDWTTDPVISTALVPIASVEGTQAAIAAPVHIGGEVVGVLAAWRRRRSLFTDTDVGLAGALADLAALGVQRADTDEQLRELSDQLTTANQALSDRYEEARQSLEIHQRLVRLVADGADLDTVVAALRSITGSPVRFAGAEGTTAGPGAWLDALVARDRTAASPLGAEAVLLGPDDRGRHAIAVTVRSAALRWGELAVATAVPVATRDVVATEQAAVACALLLSRRDALAGAGRRLESEFVWDLLAGRIVEGADALVRSRQLARDLPAPARVLLISAAGPAEASAEGIERLRTELTRGVVRVVGGHSPMGWRGTTLAVIVADRPADAVRRTVGELCALGPGLALGVSAPVDGIARFPLAGRQAAYAMAAGRPSGATVFEDLGAVQFLLEPGRGEDLDRYAEQQLGVLIAYDRDHDADLVATLRAFLRCDGHVQRAARELTIHPKTMSYRLSRIETLAGIDTTRQEDRFNAQLALKILDVREGR